MAKLFTSQKFMRQPFDQCDGLREQGPLIKVKLPIIGWVWVTTGQEALAAVLKDKSNFSMRNPSGKVAGTQWWMPKTVTLLAQNMLTMDEPDHTRLRSLVERAFRRDFIMDMEPHIQAIADGLAADLSNRSDRDGIVDLIPNFARKLPLAVICELLGVPQKDRYLFAGWAQSLTSVGGMFSFLTALRPISKMAQYLSSEIERQCITPETGLIGQLVQMQNEGEPISNDELVAMVFLLMVAGHETTTHGISGGVFALLSNPEQYKIAQENERNLPLAVEEILRFVSVVQFSKPRITRRDCDVCGVKIKRGDMVMAMIVGANGDPAIINCPHHFDIRRRPNKHVAFGAGVHFCLGHQLARLEILCALRALFNTYPNLKLGIDESAIKWRSRIGMRVLKSLPVKVSELSR